ncbi:ChaN family lipoprotein [Pseudomonas sp. MS19]|uniref:ChaN family lipoprotein n=1 Tax=Pseudomonas sp. MS19 TaxID=2579939 RepID=UPI00156268CD|nr:ChaN family lipoprotein [Pseudomonas sp. MS19]NRH27402.1 iron(III) ABC transporter [Pseudomonas sp. MS19]
MRIAITLLLLFLAGCQSMRPTVPAVPDWQSPQGREHAQLGVIIDLRSGQQISPQQLVDELATAGHVLVGEQHDNPDHHALQLWLLKALAQYRPTGSLLLEMLTPSQQGAVDSSRAATQTKQPPADLAKELSWKEGWDWSYYGPIVRYALTQPYPLLAANLDREEIMAVYRQPPPLVGSASTAASVRTALQDDIRESHCGLLPESQMPPMLAIQQQRDRRMAEQIKAAPQPSILFAGAFHVRRDLGVPLHLQDLGDSAQTRVLTLAEVGRTVTAQQSDFVWYTAATPEQDHCAKLRKP